jgi:hypothetical protein
MRLFKKIKNSTGISFFEHLAGHIYDSTIGRLNERKIQEKKIQEKIRKAQKEYIRDGNLTVDQLNSYRAVKSGKSIEMASQDEQDELQKRLQLAVYESENENKSEKYRDERMANTSKNRSKYFPEKSTRIEKMLYWDANDPDGTALRIESIERQKKIMYSHICPWDWSQYDMRNEKLENQRRERKAERRIKISGYKRAYFNNENLRKVA